jgi:hypothetical protein
MKMGLLEDMTQRVKKLGIIDLKLAQGAAMLFALVIAKLIPGMMAFLLLLDVFDSAASKKMLQKAAAFFG